MLFGQQESKEAREPVQGKANKSECKFKLESKIKREQK
jgi:hypothetical protein